jgi:hypothetical protein
MKTISHLRKNSKTPSEDGKISYAYGLAVSIL